MKKKTVLTVLVRRLPALERCSQASSARWLLAGRPRHGPGPIRKTSVNESRVWRCEGKKKHTGRSRFTSASLYALRHRRRCRRWKIYRWHGLSTVGHECAWPVADTNMADPTKSIKHVTFSAVSTEPTLCTFRPFWTDACAEDVEPSSTISTTLL